METAVGMRPVEASSEGSRTSIRRVEGCGVEDRDWICVGCE